MLTLLFIIINYEIIFYFSIFSFLLNHLKKKSLSYIYFKYGAFLLPYLKEEYAKDKQLNFLLSIDVVWLAFKNNYWRIFVFLFMKMIFAFFFSRHESGLSMSVTISWNFQICKHIWYDQILISLLLFFWFVYKLEH